MCSPHLDLLTSLPSPFPHGQRDSAALWTDPEAVAALPIPCTAGRGPGAEVAKEGSLSLGILVGTRVAVLLPGLVPPSSSNAQLCQEGG